MLKFLNTFFTLEPQKPKPPLDTRLIGPRVFLRMADPSDWTAWRVLRSDSRDFLTPWEPRWAENGLSYTFFCGLLRRYWRDWRQGKAYSFLIFKPDADGADILVGGITLNNIQRGIGQKGTLGYWIGKPFAHQGLMTEAATLLCDFAFNSLRLHRLEASCLPHNEPSKKLLRKLGFEEEGFAKSYLQINGKWEDHVLWGKTIPPHSKHDNQT